MSESIQPPPILGRRARSTLLLALAGLAWACAGCERAPHSDAADGAPSRARVKIGFVVKQPEEPWFQMEWRFAQQAADQYDFELVKIGGTDGEKVLSAIDNLGAQGAQGLIICTPDVRLGPAIVAKARGHGLKLMSVDDRFIGADGAFMEEVHHLGISAREIGRMVGASLAEQMKLRGWSADDVAVLVETYEELSTAKERTDGAMEALAAAGVPRERMHKAPQKTTDIPGAFDVANTVITQHPQVRRWLVCGNNDNAVLGAVRALEGRGFGHESVIAIGINGTDCIDELRKPAPTGFFGSILLTPRRHGFETAERMYKWVQDGVEPPKLTYTSGILIHRGNFEQVLREQGIIE